MLLNKHRLNAERGLPSPLCALPMHSYTLPIALSTVWPPDYPGGFYVFPGGYEKRKKYLSPFPHIHGMGVRTCHMRRSKKCSSARTA